MSNNVFAIIGEKGVDDKKNNENQIKKRILAEENLRKWWDEELNNYSPISAPILRQRRDSHILQTLASSEFYDATVVCRMGVDPKEAVNYSIPGTNYVYLNFLKTDTERYKKIVVLHEACHLSRTPSVEELLPEDGVFVKNNKLLVNVLEDVRINRYICLKYPGMTRYFDSELGDTQSEFIGLSIGDLVGKELTDVDKTLKIFFDRKEEIRNCVTFDDVLDVARDIVKEGESPKQNYSWLRGDESFTPGEPIQLSGGLTDEVISEIEKSLSDTRVSRLINMRRQQVYEKKDVDKKFDIKISKKEKDFFLGSTDGYKTTSLSKHKIKLLSRNYEGWKRTREGRLSKINLSKLHTDNRVFKRRYVNKFPPKVYIVLDGSGSMGKISRSWQKGLSLSLTNLFNQLKIEYQIFIHSGCHKTNKERESVCEFCYSEISEENIEKTKSFLYTLDGSMLKALFDKEVDKKRKGIVFYFSDGDIPAQFPEVQVPLVQKYDRIAEQLGIPIFGIGLNATGVDLFKHYYIVKDSDDFDKVLEDIGDKINYYL